MKYLKFWMAALCLAVALPAMSATALEKALAGSWKGSIETYDPQAGPAMTTTVSFTLNAADHTFLMECSFIYETPQTQDMIVNCSGTWSATKEELVMDVPLECIDAVFPHCRDLAFATAAAAESKKSMAGVTRYQLVLPAGGAPYSTFTMYEEGVPFEMHRQ